MPKPTSTFRAATAALAGILIAIGGCTESPASPTPQQFVQRAGGARFDLSGATTTTAVIGVEGGTLQTASGDRIVFPAGAVAAPTEISITSDPRYAGVQLQPHGLQFPAGHEPVLQLNLQATNAGTFHTLSVVYVDEDGAISEFLPTSAGSGRAVTNLHHFSGYLAISH